MPSHSHEETLKVFARRPDFIRRILKIPEDHEVKEGPRNVKPPVDRTIDGVRLVYGPPNPRTEKRRLTHVVMVEVQTSTSSLKRIAWGGYSADLRRRYKKGRPKTIVLIVTVTADVERWCQAEIDRNRREGYAFPYRLIGPSGFSKPVPPERAEDDPDITILSAIHHISSKGPKADNQLVMRSLLTLFDNANYWETCYNLLNCGFFTEAERDELEKYMRANTEDGPFDRLVRQRTGTMLEEAEAKAMARGEAKGIAKGEAKGIAEGIAKGKAEERAETAARIVEAIVDAVEMRGWSLSEAQREALTQRDTLALALCLGAVAKAPSLEALLKT